MATGIKKLKYKKPKVTVKKLSINHFASPRFLDSFDSFQFVGEVQAQSGGGSTTSCGGCLRSDSLVLMSDGSEKLIQDIMVGDTVRSLNLLTSKVENASVMKIIVHSNYDQGYITINKSLKITPNHKILINGDWKMSGNALIGDEVRSHVSPDRIQTIDQSIETCDVFDLQVDTNHNFFADHILVHNKVCFLRGTRILLADYSETEIQDLNPLTSVLGFDREKKKIVSTQATDVISHLRSDGYIKINNTLSLTMDHPVYTHEHGWIPSKNVCLGDTMISTTGETPISHIEYIEGFVEVFAIILPKSITSFFANGYMTGNYVYSDKLSFINRECNPQAPFSYQDQ